MPNVRYNDIDGLLVNTKDTKWCIQMLLGRYELPDNAAACVAAFHTIRGRLMKNADYRRTEYEREIRALADSLPEDSPDRPRLLEVLTKTLRSQYCLFALHRRFLDDRDAQERFWKINPAVEWLGNFKAPEEVIQAGKQQRRQRMVERQQHKGIVRDQSTITEAEIDTLYQRSLGIIRERSIETPGDYHDFIHALGILSGRRQCEIACYLHWKPAKHPYQCIVSGLAKKDHFNMRHGPPEFTIPLLCTWAEFNDAMCKIRAFRLPSLEENQTANTRLANGLASRTLRSFGRAKMGHTVKRNIYLHHAYKNRAINGFYTGDESCSPAMWRALALGEPYRPTTHDSYNILDIKEGGVDSDE